MIFFSDFPRPARLSPTPMTQVITALVHRHGRWRVLRAALFAGHWPPKRPTRPDVPQHLHRDVGLTDQARSGSRNRPPELRDPIL